MRVRVPGPATGLALAALLLPLAPVAGQVTPPSADKTADPARPDAAKALELAREVVRIGYPEDKRAAMFFGAVDAMTSQMREVAFARFSNDPAAKAILERNLDRFVAACKPIIDRHIPAFIEAYAQGYAREFSVAELEQLLAFVKTPAGGHFFLRSSAVLADPSFAAANQDYLRDLQPQMDLLRQQVTTELTQYYLKHPPKPATGS